MNNYKNEPYNTIAPIYDRWQNSFKQPYYKIVFNQLEKELRKHRFKPARYLDLACGTGDTAIFMKKRAWEVTGVDSSQNMLEQAKLKARRDNLDITFLQQRIQDLALPTMYQMAGSFYDSLNHITSKRMLGKALKQIRKHLDGGSLFMFDNNTLSCYRELWNTTSVGHEDGYTLIIENRFDEQSGNAVSDITIFEQHGRTLYEKKSTRVKERMYTQEEIANMLRRAGFDVIRREPLFLFSNNEPEPYKEWWVCKAV